MWRAWVLAIPLLFASAAAASSLRASSLRSLVLEGSRAPSAASHSQGTRWDMDLSNLVLVRQDLAQAAKKKLVVATARAASFVNSTMPDGKPVACLNCDPSIFKAWLGEQYGCSEEEPAANIAEGGKHPNAPGYDEWAAKSKRQGLLLRSEPKTKLEKYAAQLSAGQNLSDAKEKKLDASSKAKDVKEAMECTSGKKPEVSVNYLQDWDLLDMKPKLKKMWSERRLVVGAGPNPMHGQMDFVQALVHLSRNAPMLVPPDCDGSAPHCDTLLTGMVNVSSTSQLRAELAASFGQAFLDEHRYSPKHNATEQRAHVQALLRKLQQSYQFYHQKCLDEELGTDKPAVSCDETAPSMIVGQIACKPETDKITDSCVYAELRRCSKCNGGSAPFFEYTRLHGPLALFGTRHSRGRVMGQCEEFSRAGYSLLAAMGYEARYVLDFTDHVWIEVKLPPKDGSSKEADWVHADPSEGVLDSPLMYETGWGKKLTMIFAFTPYMVEHVTARYTKDYKATVWRRHIPEEALNGALLEANHRLKYELPMQGWGYISSGYQKSADMDLDDLALWSHFEAN